MSGVDTLVDPVDFIVSDGAGTAWPFASVQVNVHGGGAATLYADAVLRAPITNPVKAAADGSVRFYVAPGDYDLVATAQGGQTHTTYVTVAVPASDVPATQAYVQGQLAACVGASQGSIGTSSTAATLGSEELTNGSVGSGSTGWTLAGGTAWSGGYLDIPASGSASQAINVTSGTKYLISWTMQSWPGNSTDTFTVAIGANSGTVLAGGTQAVVVTAPSTGSLTFSVTAAAGNSKTYNLNSFSCKPLSGAAVAALSLNDANATARAGMFADGNGNLALGGSALLLNATGTDNTAVGFGALAALVTGEFNTAFGQGALTAVTVGYDNVAVGQGALSSATQVVATTAVGTLALGSLTTGTSNTAVGNNALAATTTGGGNTALGIGTLATNVTGNNNTALGNAVLAKSTSGQNTGVGASALTACSSGGKNAAVGQAALVALTTGSQVTAIGQNALGSATTGSNNVAVGFAAGVTATSANATVAGHDNTFVGAQAGPYTNNDPANATAVGSGALTTNYGLALGFSAKAQAGGAVAIGTDNTGAGAVSGTANLIVLGTANHTTQIPGLPAFVTGDKYLVVDSSGNIHKSALGPAS